LPEQQIIWTALPRTADASSVELDVFVSPRLGLNSTQDEYRLSDFPELEHWTKTLHDHVSFQVEFADTTRHDADVVSAPALDHEAWDHLFRASTFVRPWTFKDLSKLPIYSYPVRFITAYLRELYVDLGRRFPTLPPQRAELEPFRITVGPVTDVRVKEEREPPPREPVDIPVPDPKPGPGAAPTPAPEGCLTWLLRALLALLRLLRPLCKLMPAPVRGFFAVLARRLRERLEPDPGPPPDPTRPKGPVDRVVHPSPYVTKPPLGPPNLPHLAQLEQKMAADKVIAPTPSAGAMADALAARDTTFDFARAKRFFERPESELPPAGTPPPQKPRLDFHQALGALADYPELMRRLGLVVRLRFDRPAADPGTIRVIAKWDGQTRQSDVSPRTHCKLESSRFSAAHKPGSDLAEGMLDLVDAGDSLATDTPSFDLVQVDSDGAAFKAILTAATLERAHQLEQENVRALDRPARETTPALRSGGLAIVRPDRAWHLHQHLKGAEAKKDPKPATTAGEPAELTEDLFAEDLVRGYRIDVSTDGGTWRSLCSRVGTYDLVNDAGKVVKRVLEATDEGYVKGTSATSAAGDGKPLYVHEALARWTGWSLAAQRPGMTLENHIEGPPPPNEPYDRPQLPRSETETEFRLVTHFDAAPQSLPHLRFGSSYSMRAVCVDLAGRALAAPADSSPKTDAVTYRRFEPVGPPAALALRPFWPGESLEHIVLRSDWNNDSATYDQQEMGATAPDAVAHRTRHLFAPKTSQQMAELHGKLDIAFRQGSTPGDPDAGYRIALRESGTFRDAEIFDVNTVDVENPQPTIPFGTPELVEPLDPANEGAYEINRADATLPTPYLPDPAAAGVALRRLPGLTTAVSGDSLTVHQVRAGDDPTATEALLQVPFSTGSDSWPDYDAFRVRVAEQTGAAPQPPHWDRTERVLTVFLAKGERAEVRYSSYLLPEDLDAHGVWDWLDDGAAGNPLRPLAQHGAHWMITPPRSLVLVHAVQHPVEPARFTALKAERDEIGQTTAEFRDGKLELHVPSTGRIDVIGSWMEFLDDPDNGVVEDPRESVACDLTVREGWSKGMDFPPPDPDVRARHEFGDTRHRRVKYLLRATTSFREYVRPDLTLDELSRRTAAGDECEVHVKNSARPIVPAVLYAVPTFDWPSGAPGAGWSQHELRRGGGGLRVYLDRPWYTSGEGELLGIVLQQQGGSALRDGLRSRYGLDAIWYGPRGAAESLEPHHFPNRVKDETVSLAEETGLTATVVGFRPEWDTERKLWFCDIELDVEALEWNYWPFVRFAFVRYQPVSLNDAKISRVALGEFGQVAPDRTLSLTWQGAQQLRARLRGRAPEARQPPRVAFRVQATAVPTGQEPDELDWEHTAGHTPVADSQTFFDLVEPDDPDGDGNVLWETLVNLPAARGTKRMRVEVAEYELLESDREFGRGLTRMTYAAHVPLD
jgi:hypothetical protein